MLYGELQSELVLLGEMGSLLEIMEKPFVVRSEI
jgi:hypothetical protein